MSGARTISSPWNNVNNRMRILVSRLPYSIGVQRLWMTKGPLKNQFFYAWRPLWEAGKDRDKWPQGHWGLRGVQGPLLKCGQHGDLGEDEIECLSAA